MTDIDFESLKRQLDSLQEWIKRKQENTRGPFDFSTALVFLKKGKSVYREGWNGVKVGKTMYVETVTSLGYLDDPVLPYIDLYICDNPTKTFGKWKIWRGWIPSVEDLFSEDWYIFEEDSKKPVPDGTAEESPKKPEVL